MAKAGTRARPKRDGRAKGRSSVRTRKKASPAGRKRGSREPGQLLGKIGKEIRPNPAVEIEEYAGSELRRRNPIEVDYREMARRAHSDNGRQSTAAMKRRLLELP